VKILIAGLPKSGTTILTYRIAEALDDVVIDFEPQGGPPPDASAGGHVVTKELVGTQTSDFARYRDYDRKIWIARDPRDFLVSQSLYRWHREAPPEPIDQVWFDRVIEKLRAKEHEPGSVSFQDLEPANYFETLDAVAVLKERSVGPEWLLYRYEDMIDGRYESLNDYLGFDVVVGAEVADGLSRVVRSKGYGAWRDWFTPADVAFYESGGLRQYMDAFGYDPDDWALNDPQQIDPEHCSRYVTALFHDYREGDGVGVAVDVDVDVEVDLDASVGDGTATPSPPLLRRLRRRARLLMAASRP
jgi:hypothetical protein